MRAKNRVNLQDRPFFLTELHAVQDTPRTEIRTNWGPTQKNIIVMHDIERISEAWRQWEYGRFIQDAFHFLSADEREFIMTGLTRKDWDSMYPGELSPGEVKYEDGHIQMALPFDEKGVGNE